MKASFVLDSSVALAWCFPEEATPETRELLDRMSAESAAVPAWWFIELTNVLYLAEKKKRITPAKVAQFIALIEAFDLAIHADGSARAFAHILPLCRAHALTSYDALYLDLALTEQLPLAALDEPLRKAAAKLGVKLLGK